MAFGGLFYFPKKLKILYLGIAIYTQRVYNIIKLRVTPKGANDMTVTQIDEILNGRFENEEDRIYWENKKAEIIRKEENATENKKFYKENKVYDR
jgi:hypothetical protein